MTAYLFKVKRNGYVDMIYAHLINLPHIVEVIDIYNVLYFLQYCISVTFLIQERLHTLGKRTTDCVKIGQ